MAVGSPDKWFSKIGPVVKTEVEGYVNAYEAFRAIHRAIQTATRADDFIFLAGWDVDLKFGLIPQGPDKDLLTSLETLLKKVEAPIKRCLFDFDATNSDR